MWSGFWLGAQRGPSDILSYVLGVLALVRLQPLAVHWGGFEGQASLQPGARPIPGAGKVLAFPRFEEAFFLFSGLSSTGSL